MGYLKWSIAVALACATCFAGWRLHADLKAQAVALAVAQIRALWDAEKLATALAVQTQVAQARQREQALQAKTEQLQQERRHEVAGLQRQHAAVLDSLRQRSERPASGDGVPQAASLGETERACTGGELYREDGAFLIGEALRADELRLQLVACQAAYEAVGQQLMP